MNDESTREPTAISEKLTPPMTKDRSRRPRSVFDCDSPSSLRAMPLEVKALKSATCHLSRDHAIDVSKVGGDGPRLLELHFVAHGFDPVPSYPHEWLPWRIRSLPHSMIEQRGRVSDGTTAIGRQSLP